MLKRYNILVKMRHKKSLLALYSLEELKPGQTIATCQRNIVGRNMFCAFGHHVAMCCDMLGVVGSSLKMVELSQQHPTRRNISQQGGQTYATCSTQQCCDMLRWHVAIFWPGLKLRHDGKNERLV